MGALVLLALSLGMTILGGNLDDFYYWHGPVSTLGTGTIRGMKSCEVEMGLPFAAASVKSRGNGVASQPGGGSTGKMNN